MRIWQCILFTCSILILRKQYASGFLCAGRDRTFCTTSRRLLATTQQGFGKQEFWQKFYKDRQSDFTWYAGFQDLEPFLREWISTDDKILLPGVGMDSLLLDMYDGGYQSLSAFDYASESIEYFERIKGNERSGIELNVADARNLTLYEENSFDTIVDKGTLDAIYLAGNNKEEKLKSLNQSVMEFKRVLRPTGILWSLSNICVEALLEMDWTGWKELTNGGDLYTTRDEYTSNNVDGSLLVWQKDLP